MFGYTTIGLKNQHGKSFYYNSRKISKKAEELDRLIKRFRFLESYSEPKREIHDGIIGEYNNQTRENQTEAYKFILNHPELTEENLHTLYKLLSKKQLNEDSEIEEDRLYRQHGVYILDASQSLLLTGDMDKGVDPSLVPELMKDLFAFLERKDIDPFVKSQIAHLYFVYVHPYYDINGRTARALSLWSLTRSGKEPYTIIGRGLSFNREGYLKSVKKSLKGDMTPFLDYSLDTLKKEILIQIKLHTLRKKYSLTAEESETLELLFKAYNKTLEDLIDIFYYQRGLNDREVITRQLLQLLEKNVISYDENTGEIKILDMEKKKKSYRRTYESR